MKWRETRFEQGAQADVTRWTAILTIVLEPPTTADALRRNPLGLFVDAVDWSRELEPVTQPPRGPLQAPSRDAVSPGDPEPLPDPTAASQPQPEIRP